MTSSPQMRTAARAWGRRRLLSGLVVAVVALYALGASDAPYRLVGPGPVIEVGTPDGGSWSVTTVRVSDVGWFGWARARLAGDRLVRRTGGSAGPAPAEAPSEAMSEAQTAAALVAAQLATGREPLPTSGLEVIPGPATTAAGLHSGDVLLAVGSTTLRTPQDLAGANDRSVLLAPRNATGSLDAVRTVRLRALPAVRIQVSAIAYPLTGVDGSSAGLMLALARVDALTLGDLTGGRHIAGTGAINAEGRVIPVGEIAEKAHAAAAAGAELFLVPALQRAEATRAARGSRLTVIPVATVSEALTRLR